MEKSARKYEFTGKTQEYLGHTLHQIRALVNVNRLVKPGDLGGWIENESNLSHDGKAWVDIGAFVFENARVFGDAWVCHDTRVFGNAMVAGEAEVSDEAWVCGTARIYGDTEVCGAMYVDEGTYNGGILEVRPSTEGYLRL